MVGRTTNKQTNKHIIDELLLVALFPLSFSVVVVVVADF